ncbi:MAG TPA: aminotransferase class V-fold PLP-dependent enzyme, partial [Micromonosporaceae bacterium]|nr:aminotransferase class V-fold PLP-dependent enzyme [Micromonosporaceae bacterium]
KLPIRAIADSLSPGVLLCVDGVHGFGVEDATPDQLGCDFLISGCHKWLFGPRGTGLVWGSTGGWARCRPVIPSFDRRSIGAWLGFAGQPVPAGPGATPGGYHSFEHRWALADAFRFHAAIGRPRIAERTRQLATALKDGLAALPKVRMVTPKSSDLSAGVVCAEIAGVEPEFAVRTLRAHNVIASATPYNPSYLRFGTSMVTGERDIESALAAVRGITG